MASLLPHNHFTLLRAKINTRLDELELPHRREQQQYEWLYGALGVVPADVMFICENPSLAGVRQAHVQTIDGGPPDIEAQWWGGPRNACAKRFRGALCQLGLKTTPVAARGGWECYITNVIKEANIAGEQEGMTNVTRLAQGRVWAPILRWELEEVKPSVVITVGGRAHAVVTELQNEGLLQSFYARQVVHYSARKSDVAVIENIVSRVRVALTR